MLQPPLKPRHVLMTLDAVGGVWRYSIDLCRALEPHGLHFLLVGLGPEPSPSQWEEVRALRNAEVVWLDIPLDWQAENARQLESQPGWLSELARRWKVDLLHLNLPSQAVGLDVGCPVIVASHSCLSTWWQAVRGGELPAEWIWNYELNARGLQAANLVITPSRSHAKAVAEVYGLRHLPIRSVPNGTAKPARRYRKAQMVLAAGRWWDDGKNGTVIDAAAESVDWPLFMAGSLSGPDGQEVRLQHACPLGERRPEDLQRLMGRASIFVSASRFEPFGLAALEAAAAETALVLSDIPTFRELWDGAALFVAPDDANGFAAAINRLIEERDVAAMLACAARERAAAYTLDIQATTMKAIYSEALARRTDEQPASAVG